MKEIVFHLNLLGKTYFFVKLTGQAMGRPASSDKWKAPLVLIQSFSLFPNPIYS